MKTIEEEARALRVRFEGVNRAAFAREHGVPGGGAMIYQHLNALKPISLDAAKAYARGFGCSIEDISQRLAAEVSSAAKNLVEFQTLGARQISDGDLSPSADTQPASLTRKSDAAFAAAKDDPCTAIEVIASALLMANEVALLQLRPLFGALLADPAKANELVPEIQNHLRKIANPTPGVETSRITKKTRITE